MIEEAGPDKNAEGGAVESYSRADEVDPRNGVLTIRANIVSDYEAPI